MYLWRKLVKPCKLGIFIPDKKLSAIGIITTCFYLLSDEYLSKQSYWEKYYKGDTQQMDWMVGSSVVAVSVVDKLKSHFAKSTHPLALLDFGCGSSMVSKDISKLCGDSIQITLLDYIHQALVWQQNNHLDSNVEHKLRHHFDCIQGDARTLPFRNETFDVILDKGTLDSLLKDRTSGIHVANCALEECHRLLRRGGLWFQITDEDPDLRLGLIESNLSSVTTSFSSLGDDMGFEYFMYIIQKLK